MLSSPRRPSSTIWILSSAEWCLRVARRRPLIVFTAADICGPDFCLKGADVGHELEYTVDVRPRGVDSPELRLANCDWERKIAAEAKSAIETRFPVGSWVYIENVEEGSFSGRIVADIKQRYGNQRWRTVTKVLLEREGRWGVPYDRNHPFDWRQDLPSEEAKNCGRGC